MIYVNNETGDRYVGGTMTICINGSLFSGIPTVEQLESWGYIEEIPSSPQEPTLEEIKRERMDEILLLLQNTDYIILKKAEGIDISSYDEQYDGNFLLWRLSLRDEYNLLEDSLDNLNND